MKIGKSYKLSEFLFWTRRNTYRPLVIGIISIVLYQILGFKWIAVPWSVVALLGSATAFIVGFKNVQTYSRTWDARQIWGSIQSISLIWGTMCRDYLDDQEKRNELAYRHFAWLAALRYDMRAVRDWETTSRVHNYEYKKYYSIPELEIPLEMELAKYISAEELGYILETKNKAAHLLGLQSKSVKIMLDGKKIEEWKFMEFQNIIKRLFEQQGRSETIENFPYPRQYATVNKLFVNLFCILLPFGMLQEFDKFSAAVSGQLQGILIWLVVPFSVLISWVFTSLEQVGESTENPFEGSANDVPISQMSRNIEIDIRQMLGEINLPPALEARNNIIL